MLSSLSKIPLNDEVIDVVFLLNILEHLDNSDINRCLTEVFRVLKIEGKIVIYVPNGWIKYFSYIFGIPYHLVAHRYLHKYEKPSFHVNEPSPISLIKTLKRHGFKIKKFWFEEKFPMKRADRLFGLLFFMTEPLFCIAYKEG